MFLDTIKSYKAFAFAMITILRRHYKYLVRVCSPIPHGAPTQGPQALHRLIRQSTGQDNQQDSRTSPRNAVSSSV